MLIGGIGGSTSTTSDSNLASVEIFPPPSSSGCSIPDLPGTRYYHSLSLLSGGRLVVCGGSTSNCISWVAGNATWTIFGTMRCEDKKDYAIIVSSSCTVTHVITTLPGHLHHFLTPLSCLATLQELRKQTRKSCQVKRNR